MNDPVDTLSLEFYRDLTLDQIQALVGLESKMIVGRLSDEKMEELRAALLGGGDALYQKAIRLYAAMAERISRYGLACEWYRLLAQVTGDREPLLGLCLRLGVGCWSEDFISSYDHDHRTEALAVLHPFLIEHLESVRRGVCTSPLTIYDFELAKQMAEIDGGVSAKLSARLLIRQAIREGLDTFVKELLEYLGRPMNKTETRLYLSRLIVEVRGTCSEDAIKSGHSVARKIVQLGMVDEFGYRLIKRLAKQAMSFRGFEEILKILGLPLCEEDLLTIYAVHALTFDSREELVLIASKLANMSGDHLPKVQEALSRARARCLRFHLLRDAHRYGSECRNPLTVTELRAQLLIFEEWDNPHTIHRYVPEQTFAREQLARLLYTAGRDRFDPEATEASVNA